MIVVHRYQDRICIAGHANFAEYGKDIICAAVSVLTETLIHSIEKLTDVKMYTGIEPGKVNIEIKNQSDIAKVLVDSFFIGIAGVAEAYPDYVQLSCSEIPTGSK